jgi:hypothetical protein
MSVISSTGIRCSFLLPSLAVLLLSGLNRPAQAAIMDLGANNFGHLSQNDPGLANVCTANNLSYSCGPVAAVNSFVYLQTAYPGLYDNSLIDMGSLVKTATDLSAPAFMDCAACNGGTLINNFATGKAKWIEGSVPGKTAYSIVQNPTIDYLIQDLSTCWFPSARGVPCGQDVELLIGFYDRTGARVGGHYVTLYMASSGADGAMVGFIDPDPNPALNTADPYTILGGPLAGVVQINNYGPPGTLARIDFAIDESPVPEPAAFLLLLVALPLMNWAIRRRDAHPSPQA